MRLLIALLFLPVTAMAFCTVTDDVGNKISLTAPAKRIISLAPDITENLFAIGAGKHLVGVIAGSDFPAAAKKVTQVGAYTGLDLERILDLHPDLIVTWNSAFVRQTNQLSQLTIPIYHVNPVYLDDIPRTLKNLGCLTGHESQSTAVAASFNQQLRQLKNKYQRNQSVQVYFQLGAYNLLTINKKSWINQAIELCGGVNPFASAILITSEIGAEALLAADPDIIFSDSPNIDMSRFPTIKAVKNKNIYPIQADWIDRASPRLLLGVKRMCEMISAQKKSKAVG